MKLLVPAFSFLVSLSALAHAPYPVEVADNIIVHFTGSALYEEVVKLKDSEGFNLHAVTDYGAKFDNKEVQEYLKKNNQIFPVGMQFVKRNPVTEVRHLIQCKVATVWLEGSSTFGPASADFVSCKDLKPSNH